MIPTLICPEDKKPCTCATNPRYKGTGCPRERKLILHCCSTCGAEEGSPCRTPKSRRKENVHDARPFSITTINPTAQASPSMAPSDSSSEDADGLAAVGPYT